MAEEANSKWEGQATAKLKGPTAEQVWPFLEDFFSLDKYFPGIDTCYQVELPGQSGLIRYCSSTTEELSSGSHGKKSTLWAREKLLNSDPINRCISYEILDNNIGFTSYVATIKVLPIYGDGGPGCQIEWSFVANPVEGWKLEHLVSYVENKLCLVAKNLEEALKPKE